MRGQIPLGPLLDQLLSRLGLANAVAEQKAVMLWPQIIGPLNARHCWAERVRDKVLFVTAGSHAWAQELSMLKAQMLERLNAALGKPVIRDIHFRAGRKRPPTTASPVAPQPLPVSAAERAQATALAAQIPHPELRPHLERAVLHWQRARHWWQAQGWRRCIGCGDLHRRRERFCFDCQAQSRRRGRRKETIER